MSITHEASQVRPEASREPDRSQLDVLSDAPFNAEARLTSQMGTITPNTAFYVREHLLSQPPQAGVGWRLRVEGEVRQSLALSYEELRVLPERSVLVTLECAGNGRAYMGGQPQGESWHYGGVGTAEWMGVPLWAVLEQAGLKPAVQEIVIEGADHGYHPESKQEHTYVRSLPRDVALHPDTLLAYSMNGEPLPQAHGFPLRLIVPDWYGMASVKWVTRLHASAQPFKGYFQTQQYVLIPKDGDSEQPPLERIRPRSLILSPVEGARLARGQHWLKGVAWSGEARIWQVEVSVDGGATWQLADWTSAPLPHAWQSWQLPWEATTPGPATLSSRATDEAGNTQPLTAEWNRLGYANNAIQQVHVTVA
jgi:sulfite oxidase